MGMGVMAAWLVMATDIATAKQKRVFFIRLCGRGANAGVRDVFMINLSSDMFHVMKADCKQILSVSKEKVSKNEAFLARLAESAQHFP